MLSTNPTELENRSRGTLLPTSDLRTCRIHRSAPLGRSSRGSTPVGHSRLCLRSRGSAPVSRGLRCWSHWHCSVLASRSAVHSWRWSLGGLAGRLCLLELLLSLLGVAVEEEVHHHIPGLARDGSAKAPHLASEHPVKQTNRVAGLVVGWDSDVDEPQRRVGIAECNDWNVHIRGLTDGLVVCAGIGENEQARLLVVLLDLVGEATRGEAASNVLSTSVLGIFEHSTLTIWAGRNHAHISWVLDGHDDTSSEHHLLPGLGEVDDVHTVRTTLECVSLHLKVDVLGTEMHLAGEHLLDVIFSVGEVDGHCRQICGLQQKPPC